jgi:hypothetical protein
MNNMPSRNVHEVMGHLGKDPELRVTPTGKSVFCRFSVATSNRVYEDGYHWEDPNGNTIDPLNAGLVRIDTSSELSRACGEGFAICGIIRCLV